MHKNSVDEYFTGDQTCSCSRGKAILYEDIFDELSYSSVRQQREEDYWKFMQRNYVDQSNDKLIKSQPK